MARPIEPNVVSDARAALQKARTTASGGNPESAAVGANREAGGFGHAALAVIGLVMPAQSPRRVTTILAAIAAVLGAIFVATQAIAAATGHDSIFGLVPMFNMNDERNLPAWFSSMLLGGAALILVAVARVVAMAGERWTYYWLALAGGFLFLSADESISLHEKIIPLLAAAVRSSDATAVGAAGMLVLVGGLSIAFGRFLFALPANFRVAFVLSGAIYLGGVLGVDFVHTRYHDYWAALGPAGLISIVLVEESMELCGAIMFIHFLLRFLQEKTSALVAGSRR